MYLTTEELKTHAYSEEITTIIRGDETIALASIDMAIEFVKSKLMRHYDVEAVFSAKGKERNPLVLNIVKDIALWNLIGLSNPSIDYEDKKFRYEQAVDWLTAVMPTTLPKLEETEDDDLSTGSSFSFHSNPKRTTHF